MYDLKVGGVADLSRSALFRTRTVKRDGLSGLVDSSNKVFRTTYYPLLSSGSITLYTSGSVVSPSGYTVDYETGAVVFETAPAVQPEADYIYTQLSESQFIDILIAGLDEMEGRWNRALVLSSNAVTYVVATRDSTHIYVGLRAADDAMSDPTFRGTTFSNSRTQIRLFIACCEYVLLQMRAEDAAPSLFTFREGTGGLMVDKSRIPANIERALERKEKQLSRLMEIAQGEYYEAGEPWGGYVAPVVTEEYEEVYDWQEEARDQDRRSS